MRGPPALAHGPRAGRGAVVLRGGLRGGPARAGASALMEERRLGPVVGLGTWNTLRRRRRAGAERGRRRVRCGQSGSSIPRRCTERPSARSPRRSKVGASRRSSRPRSGRAPSAMGRRSSHGSSSGSAASRSSRCTTSSSWREHLPWLEAEREAGESVGSASRTTTRAPSASSSALCGRSASKRVQVPLNPFERDCEQRDPAPRGGTRARRPRDAPARGRRASPPATAPEALAPLRDFGVTTWPQALIKWALSDERVDVAIPATRDPAHARENAAAGEPPWFGPDERRLVERLAAA